MVPVDGENKGVIVPIDNDIRSIGWLIGKVTELAWKQYGVEVNISYRMMMQWTMLFNSLILALCESFASWIKSSFSS